MASKVLAGQAFIKISADLRELKKGADTAKKVMMELKASVKALGSGNVGKALSIGVHAIGTAISAVGGKIKYFGTRVNAIGRSILGFGSKLMAFAGVGAAGVVFVTKKFIELGDALNKMSARTGATVEWLSAMSYAAERSGANVELLEQAIRRLNKAIAEAQNGSKSQRDAFAKLNIDPNSSVFKSMNVGDQFELVARRLNAIRSQAQKTQIAMQLFGKSGTMLLPMLGDIDKLKKKAQELGIVMTKEQADAAAALLDAWTSVKYQMTSLFVSLGEMFAPALKQVAEMISKWIVPVRNFIKAHRELFILMAKGLAMLLIIGGAVASLGAVLAGIGVAIKYIGAAIVGIGTVIKGLAVAIGTLFGFVGKTTGLVGRLFSYITKTAKTLPALAFILTHPWMATVNAILIVTMVLNKLVRLLAGFGPFMNRIALIAIGQIRSVISVVKTLISMLNPATWARMVMQTLSLIWGEIAKIGTIMAGWSISTWAWLAAVVAVLAVIGYVIYKTNALGKLWQWLKGVWQDTCDFFIGKWKETTDAIGDSLGVIWDAVLLGNFKQAWDLLCKNMLVTWNIWTLEISDTWDALVANLSGLWSGFTNTMAKGWDWTVNRILVAWEYVKGKLAYGWEWVAGACKAAFNIIVLWIENTFDSIMTSMKQMLNRLKAWTPGVSYTSEDADRENAMLDRELERRQSQRESQFSKGIVQSDERLRQIEAQTQARIQQLNAELKDKMDMYNKAAEMLKSENDDKLTAEMMRRRQDIERLKQEIAKETEDLRAKNEAMKKENAIQHEDYYKVWEDIEDNTAETAENTAQHDATADVNAAAISARWGGLWTFVQVINKAILQAQRNNQAKLQKATNPQKNNQKTQTLKAVQPKVKEATEKKKPALNTATTPQKTNQKAQAFKVVQPQVKEAVQQRNPVPKESVELKQSIATPQTDREKLDSIATSVAGLQETITSRIGFESKWEQGMTEKMQRLLDKLTELTRNSKKYAENVEEMLTVQ